MSEQTIHISSTLEALTLHDFQVEGSVLGEFVAQIFTRDPSLPGVIILDRDHLRGMISRRRFLEALSRAYGRELFLRRPLTVLQNFVPQDALVMPGSTPITAAATRVIKRPVEILNEPLVVELQPGLYRLLDIHDLLIAQSNIHQITSQLLQEKTRSEMMHTEKLASLGKLLAGVAHEIRNPVNFIAGNLHHLEAYSQDLQRVLRAYQSELPAPSPDLQALEADVDLDFLLQDLPSILASITKGTDRLQGLVNSLRMFSRIDDTTWDQVDVHQSIEGTLLMLNNRLKTSSIQVVKDYGHLPVVQGYPSQLSQVFMNLISNAIDALETMPQAASEATSSGDPTTALMASNQAPQLMIQTRMVANLPVEVLPPSPPTGRWVSICIRDNGPGIPKTIQPQIFEEFFTTKAPDAGTGLGLPITAQIVRERHQGYLLLRSPCLEAKTDRPAHGTEFEILLPAADADLPANQPNRA